MLPDGSRGDADLPSRRLLLWGFVAWIAGSTSFRVTGPLDRQEDALELLLLHVATVPLVTALTVPLYRRYRLRSSEYVGGGALLALPGMLLDAASILFFEWSYPAFPSAAAGGYSAWLLFLYSSILGVALVCAMRSRHQEHAT